MTRQVDWDKVASLRVAAGAFFSAAIVAAILGALWGPLAYVAIPLGLFTWLALVTDPTVVVRCPHCRLRAKMGATSCHHCGREIAAKPPAT